MCLRTLEVLLLRCISSLNLTTNFSSCSVRRIPAVVVIGALSFTIGLASALDVNIFVNQDAVWAHALILSGCFLIFLVIRYNPLKFRKNIYNNVRGAACTLTTLTSSSSSSSSSVVWYRGLANATAVVDCCRVSCCSCSLLTHLDCLTAYLPSPQVHLSPGGTCDADLVDCG